jgi:hypothetical protein
MSQFQGPGVLLPGVVPAVRSAHRARLALLAVLSAALCLGSCFVLTASGVAAAGATSAGGCLQWIVSGRWVVRQSNTSVPYSYTLGQRGRVVSGTAIFGNGATAWTGTVRGTLIGDRFNVVVTLKSPQGRTIKGRYTATVGSGSMRGSTHQIGDPSNRATWSATGQTRSTRLRGARAPSCSTKTGG